PAAPLAGVGSRDPQVLLPHRVGGVLSDLYDRLHHLLRGDGDRGLEVRHPLERLVKGGEDDGAVEGPAPAPLATGVRRKRVLGVDILHRPPAEIAASPHTLTFAHSALRTAPRCRSGSG